MLNQKLQQLHEKKALLDTFRPLPSELVANLEEWYKIELTYSSNAIEGNTLTRSETAMVVAKGLTIRGKSLNEHLEAINHAEALDYIKTLVGIPRQELREIDILSIHRLILDKVNTDKAGKYRHVPVRIGGSNVTFPEALAVPGLMQDFVAWLHESNDDPVAVAAKAHFKLVRIHPFIDGNGRTSRLLMNLLLMQAGYPPAIIKKSQRDAYIDALEEVDNTSEITVFEQFIYEAIETSLDIYLAVAQGKNFTYEGQDIIPVIKSKLAQDKLLTIGQLAILAGVEKSTLRFWTDKGLLMPDGVTPKGYKLFKKEQLATIRKIRQLQAQKSKLTLDEIKDSGQKTI
jgi:Fic family protein